MSAKQNGAPKDAATQTESPPRDSQVSLSPGWAPAADGMWRNGEWWIALEEDDHTEFYVANASGRVVTGTVPTHTLHGFRDLVGLLDQAPDLDKVDHRGLEGWYEIAEGLAWEAYTEAVIAEAEESAKAAATSTTVTWAKDVQSKKVHWLWTNRIPYQMLAEIIGDEGLGKSAALCKIIADATHGKLLGQDGPITVLVIAHEDAWNVTVKPRLIAAGADMGRVARLAHSDGAPIMFPKDTALVAKDMRLHGAKLLCVDPFGAHIESRKTAYSGDELRQKLHPLLAVAEAGNFAVLGIRHTNRANTTNARNRSSDSVAYRQTARVQMIFGRDPDAPESDDTRILVGSKTNFARARALRFHMELVRVALDDGNEDDIIRARIGEETGHTDTEVLKAADPDADVGRGRPPVDREIAKAFLQRILSPANVGTDGVRSVDVLDAAVNGEMIAPRTLHRAKADLGVTATQRSDGWWWALPPVL